MIIEKRPEKQINMKTVKSLSAKFNIPEAIVKLMFLRDINTEEKIKQFLTPDVNAIKNPFLLNNMREVVDKINKAIDNNSHILIFGDYDVDGMSATSIMYLYLLQRGVKVSYFLPNRYVDEYGLTKGALTKIKESFNPDLIITVDCGITAVEEVEFAKKLGMEIIITDHHEVPSIIPNCLIINAKITPQAYSFRELCGSGVALKLVQALGGMQAFDEFVDIAALATIADIVDLTDENRLIVQLGLKKLTTKPREGIKMLLKELKLLPSTLNSIDMAFKLSPRINAAGRMGEAEVGLQLFIEKDRKKLALIVKKLLELNTKRQVLCQIVYEEALEKLSETNLTNQKIIILEDANWDSGLLGIVAARLCDEFNKPTVLFSHVDGKFKGSARSIDGIDIHKAISCVEVDIDAFGGHTMAAGLTVREANYKMFKEQLTKCVDDLFDINYFEPKKYYDIDLKVEDVSLDFVKQLNLLAPFGHKNPLPIFNLHFKHSKIATMSNYAEHLTLFFNKNFSLIHFNGANNLLNYSYYKHKNALIEIQLNTFRGKESVRGIVKAVQFSDINLKETVSFIKGNYLEQLTYEKLENSAKYELYDENAFEEFISSKIKQKALGNLVVFSNINTYEKYKDLIKNLFPQTHLFEVNDKLGVNSTVIGLNNFNNLNSFNNIIFADAVLSQNFIAHINKNTDAQIFVSSINFNKHYFKISLKREVFGIYFNALKHAARQKITAINLYFYFDQLKSLNKHITNFNYPQFLACLNVFLELKILEEVKSQYSYSLKFNKNIKSSLENSQFYNELKN
jgi:single-stranded-DNA-specific exonuclease